MDKFTRIWGPIENWHEGPALLSALVEWYKGKYFYIRQDLKSNDHYKLLIDLPYPLIQYRSESVRFGRLLYGQQFTSYQKVFHGLFAIYDEDFKQITKPYNGSRLVRQCIEEINVALVHYEANKISLGKPSISDNLAMLIGFEPGLLPEPAHLNIVGTI